MLLFLANDCYKLHSYSCMAMCMQTHVLVEPHSARGTGEAHFLAAASLLCLLTSGSWVAAAVLLPLTPAPVSPLHTASVVASRMADTAADDEFNTCTTWPVTSTGLNAVAPLMVTIHMMHSHVG